MIFSYQISFPNEYVLLIDWVPHEENSIISFSHDLRISLNKVISNLLSAEFPMLIFDTTPIKIPSGKMVDIPPVSMVSPIFKGACLGISESWTIL